MAGEMKIFSGSSNLELAKKICNLLSMPLSRSKIFQFSEGNIYIKLLENVRRKEVFFIQSGLTPINDLIMETLFFIDAFKRSSASSVTVVLPYFPYTKGDKKDEPRVSIRAKVVSEIIQASGADRVVTIDLQPPQIQGFFRIPVDNLYAMPIFYHFINSMNLSDPVVVAPDFGAAKMANNFSKLMNASVALGSKKRFAREEDDMIMDIIGDVNSKDVIVVDDMIITGNTILEVGKLLKERGAQKIFICVTHARITEEFIAELDQSPVDQLIITDTLPLTSECKHPKITQLSVAPLLSEAISSIYNGDSLSKLFTRVEWLSKI